MIFDMPTCGGCRTCELACGFRHTGEFNPSASSIRILEKEDGHGYHVQLLEADEGATTACDGCQRLGEQRCVKSCRESNDLAEILGSFIQAAEPQPGVKARGSLCTDGRCSWK
jgi:Fe-S-cluster-containing hydrogenase component 2